MQKYLVVYGKPRFLGVLSLEKERPLERGAMIYAKTDRGEELVTVIGETPEKEITAPPREATKNKGRSSHHQNPIQKIHYLEDATQDLLDEREELLTHELEILSTARKILRKHDLAMKLVDAEFLPGKKKLFLYFTSEDRVDFRSYVRDLAREFKTRIELRQIGIRDEARVVGGLASCGRPCCCSYWLHQFSPICIRMVKEQNLALNPTKISGICGRLMCCMAYEHPMYKELWDHLPNPGTKIRGPEATYVLAGVDIAARTARILGMGQEIALPLDSYEDFCAAIKRGESWNTDSSAPEEGGRSSRRSVPQRAAPERTPKPSDSEKPEKGDDSEPRKKLQRRRKSPKKNIGTSKEISSEKKDDQKKISRKPSKKPRKNFKDQEKTSSAPGEKNAGEGSQKKPKPRSRKPQGEPRKTGKPASPENKDRQKGAPEGKGKNEAAQPPKNQGTRKRRRRPRKRPSTETSGNRERPESPRSS